MKSSGLVMMNLKKQQWWFQKKKTKGEVHNYTLEVKKYQWMRKKRCNLLFLYKIQNNQLIKFKIYKYFTIFLIPQFEFHNNLIIKTGH